MKPNQSVSGSLLTKREVAALIGGGASTKLIDELVRRRKLPAIKFGHRTVRFNRTKVEQAIGRLEVASVE